MHTPLRIKRVDSITELTPADAGCVAISGSHGGTSAGRYALAARPLLSVFNDAGVGLHQAGIAALDELQAHGLAACAVAHSSACIGSAESTWHSGVISHANPSAVSLGMRPGLGVQAAIEHLRRRTEEGLSHPPA